MILKASQRGGAIQLARHLLNSKDNDHVTVHQLKGFMANDLLGAFKEAYGISLGTKCVQYLFSVSLNPPEWEKVSIDVFEKTIGEIEQKFGLTGQPRAIVFHEKQGRRHAHCVWSRIDAQEMKAINLPHFKLKLRDMSRELYFEHKWKMPRGLMDSKARDPLSFDLATWQQAKRLKEDPRTIKKVFQECWAVSDSRASFASALSERGYYLCRGNRRSHVALDWRGEEVFAVSRMVGIKAKEVRAKLGDPDELPGLSRTKATLEEKISDRLRTLREEEQKRHAKELAELEKRRRALVLAMRKVRHDLLQKQKERRIKEAKIRAARLPTGLKALWMRMTGKLKAIQEQNEAEARAAEKRDQEEVHKMAIRQSLRRRQATVIIQETRNLSTGQKPIFDNLSNVNCLRAASCNCEARRSTKVRLRSMSRPSPT